MPYSLKRKDDKANHNNLDLDRAFYEVLGAFLDSLEDGSAIEAMIREFGIEKCNEILNADIDTAFKIISNHFNEKKTPH